MVASTRASKARKSTKSSVQKPTTPLKESSPRKPSALKTPEPTKGPISGHRLYKGPARLGRLSAKSPTWEKIKHGKRVGFFVPEEDAVELIESSESNVKDALIQKAEKYHAQLRPLVAAVAAEPDETLYWPLFHLRKAQDALFEIKWGLTDLKELLD